MAEWTTSIPEQLRVKLFLDTNVLSYLVDNTYPSLTKFITVLGDSPMCDLISSKYVIHEFMGIRKREHYLRKQVELDEDGRVLNISSLIRFKDSWSVPGKDFIDLKKEVEEDVESDIDKITSDYNIQYDRNVFHDNLMTPTMKLCLGSKISKEDSLVACSSVHPQENLSEPVYLLTNDKDFHNYLSQTVTDGIFPSHLHKPTSIYLLNPFSIQNDSGEKITLLLKEENTEEYIVSFIKNWLKVLCKDNHFYLGKVFKADIPREKTLYFKLSPKVKLTQNLYISVVNKDFLKGYNIQEELSDFWNNGKIEAFPFESDDTSNISIELKNEFLKDILEEGNLLFIHPDSE